MKMIDEILEMYQHHFTGDEEDADIIVLSLLESLDKDDLMKLVKEMEEEELFSMIAMYMIETLKQKMSTLELESPSKRHLH